MTPLAITDPALRLAILETLELPLRGFPEPTLEHRINPKSLRALLTIPLSDWQLARIPKLRWEGGGHAIQQFVWPD